MSLEIVLQKEVSARNWELFLLVIRSSGGIVFQNGDYSFKFNKWSKTSAVIENVHTGKL